MTNAANLANVAAITNATATDLTVSGNLTVTGTTTLPGGTANGVAYLNGSKVVTTGSALTFDGTNLGIGTSSPGYKLNVSGNGYLFAINGGGTSRVAQTFGNTGGVFDLGIEGSAGGTLFTGASAYAAALGSSNATPLQLATNGTVRATLDTSGNLGLGVTPSAWSQGKAFEISAVGEGLWGNGLGDIWMLNGAYYNSGFKYSGSTKATAYRQGAGTTDGSHSWHVAGSGTAGNAITFTQAMTLDTSGRLGLAVTSPSARFHLDGDIWMDASGATRLKITHTGGGEAQIDASTAALRFATGGSERARIDSSGNLLVGTTTSGSRRLYVAGSNAGYITSTENTNASPFGLQIYYSAAAPNGTSNQFIECVDSSATRFRVYSNGGIANYSGNNVNLSDRREKTNFAPAGDYLSKICSIPVQTFNYIDQNLEEDAGLTLGVVAQDVQAVAPELVKESNWGTEDEPKMRLSIYQTDLQYALMKCIQEQQAIIEQLKADVAALKGN